MYYGYSDASGVNKVPLTLATAQMHCSGKERE